MDDARQSYQDLLQKVTGTKRVAAKELAALAAEPDDGGRQLPCTSTWKERELEKMGIVVKPYRGWLHEHSLLGQVQYDAESAEKLSEQLTHPLVMAILASLWDVQQASGISFDEVQAEAMTLVGGAASQFIDKMERALHQKNSEAAVASVHQWVFERVGFVAEEGFSLQVQDLNAAVAYRRTLAARRDIVVLRNTDLRTGGLVVLDSAAAAKKPKVTMEGLERIAGMLNIKMTSLLKQPLPSYKHLAPSLPPQAPSRPPPMTVDELVTKSRVAASPIQMAAQSATVPSGDSARSQHGASTATAQAVTTQSENVTGTTPSADLGQSKTWSNSSDSAHSDASNDSGRARVGAVLALPTAGADADDECSDGQSPRDTFALLMDAAPSEPVMQMVEFHFGSEIAQLVYQYLQSLDNTRDQEAIDALRDRITKAMSRCDVSVQQLLQARQLVAKSPLIAIEVGLACRIPC